MGPWRNRVCVFWESTRDLDLVREVFGLGCIPKPDHAHGFQEHLLEVRHRQPTCRRKGDSILLSPVIGSTGPRSHSWSFIWLSSPALALLLPRRAHRRG